MSHTINYVNNTKENVKIHRVKRPSDASLLYYNLLKEYHLLEFLYDFVVPVVGTWCRYSSGDLPAIYTFPQLR